MNDILKQIEQILSPVYLVGGCVRDELMGIVPKDYDFSTPLEPDVVEQKIRDAGKKPFLTGKRFGTIGVKIGSNIVEITTFRSERYKNGSRKPEVDFVDNITADLSRRDFTINAIAKRNNVLIDPFEGRKDIEKKIIRCVGTPTSRFNEDPLRMLRAARFSAQLGFIIDDATFASIKKLNYKVLNVSKERWGIELDKLLTSPFVDTGLNYLMDTGLLRYIIPELFLQYEYDQQSKYHSYNLWKHTVVTTSLIKEDIDLRWAALLHDIGKPFVRIEKEKRSVYSHHELLGFELVIRFGTYLRWPKRRIKTVSELVKNHLQENSPLRDADNRAK